MASIQPRFTSGPRTYEAVEVFAGGTLLEARAGGVDNPGCGAAADASSKVIGVAQKDANPAGGTPRAPVAGVLDQTLSPKEVAVISDGFVPVKYSTAAAYGDRLVAGAEGTVKPFVPATHNAAQIVGWCAEKAGVALNGTGLTRINL